MPQSGRNLAVVAAATDTNRLMLMHAVLRRIELRLVLVPTTDLEVLRRTALRLVVIVVTAELDQARPDLVTAELDRARPDLVRALKTPAGQMASAAPA